MNCFFCTQKPTEKNDKSSNKGEEITKQPEQKNNKVSDVKKNDKVPNPIKEKKNDSSVVPSNKIKEMANQINQKKKMRNQLQLQLQLQLN